MHVNLARFLQRFTQPGPVERMRPTCVTAARSIYITGRNIVTNILYSCAAVCTTNMQVINKIKNT